MLPRHHSLISQACRHKAAASLLSIVQAQAPRRLRLAKAKQMIVAAIVPSDEREARLPVLPRAGTRRQPSGPSPLRAWAPTPPVRPPRAPSLVLTGRPSGPVPPPGFRKVGERECCPAVSGAGGRPFLGHGPCEGATAAWSTFSDVCLQADGREASLPGTPGPLAQRARVGNWEPSLAGTTRLFRFPVPRRSRPAHPPPCARRRRPATRRGSSPPRATSPQRPASRPKLSSPRRARLISPRTPSAITRPTAR